MVGEAICSLKHDGAEFHGRIFGINTTKILRGDVAYRIWRIGSGELYGLF